MAVTHGGDTVGVRGKIVKLGGSLVPIVSAQPAMVASVAHNSLLHEIEFNGAMRFLCTSVGRQPSAGNADRIATQLTLPIRLLSVSAFITSRFAPTRGAKDAAKIAGRANATNRGVSSTGLADYLNRQPAFFPSKLLCYLSVRDRNDQQVVDCAYCSQERKPTTKLDEGEEDCGLEGG